MPLLTDYDKENTSGVHFVKQTLELSPQDIGRTPLGNVNRQTPGKDHSPCRLNKVMKIAQYSPITPSAGGSSPLGLLSNHGKSPSRKLGSHNLLDGLASATVPINTLVYRRLMLTVDETKNSYEARLSEQAHYISQLEACIKQQVKLSSDKDSSVRTLFPPTLTPHMQDALSNESFNSADADSNSPSSGSPLVTGDISISPATLPSSIPTLNKIDLGQGPSAFRRIPPQSQDSTSITCSPDSGHPKELAVTEATDACSKTTDACTETTDACSKTTDACTETTDACSKTTDACTVTSDACTETSDACTETSTPCAETSDACTETSDATTETSDACTETDNASCFSLSEESQVTEDLCDKCGNMTNVRSETNSASVNTDVCGQTVRGPYPETSNVCKEIDHASCFSVTTESQVMAAKAPSDKKHQAQRSGIPRMTIGLKKPETTKLPVKCIQKYPLRTARSTPAKPQPVKPNSVASQLAPVSRDKAVKSVHDRKPDKPQRENWTDLHKQMTIVQKENKKIVTKDMLDQSVEQLKGKLKDKEEEIRSQLSTINDLQHDLDLSKDSHREEVQRLIEALQGKELRVCEIEGEKAGVEETVSRQRTYIQSLQADLDHSLEKQRELCGIQDQFEAHQLACKENEDFMIEEQQSLADEVREKGRENADLSKRLAAAEQECEQLQAEIHRLRSSQQETELELETVKDEAHRLLEEQGEEMSLSLQGLQCLVQLMTQLHTKLTSTLATHTQQTRPSQATVGSSEKSAFSKVKPQKDESQCEGQMKVMVACDGGDVKVNERVSVCEAALSQIYDLGTAVISRLEMEIYELKDSLETAEIKQDMFVRRNKAEVAGLQESLKECEKREKQVQYQLEASQEVLKKQREGELVWQQLLKEKADVIDGNMEQARQAENLKSELVRVQRLLAQKEGELEITKTALSQSDPLPDQSLLQNNIYLQQMVHSLQCELNNLKEDAEATLTKINSRYRVVESNWKKCESELLCLDDMIDGVRVALAPFQGVLLEFGSSQLDKALRDIGLVALTRDSHKSRDSNHDN